MVHARPKVATSLRKMEHAIQMHCVLHGKCSESNATQKVDRFFSRKKQSLSPNNINFTRRVKLKCQFCEVKLTHVFQKPCKLNGKQKLRRYSPDCPHVTGGDSGGQLLTKLSFVDLPLCSVTRSFTGLPARCGALQVAQSRSVSQNRAGDPQS